MGKGKRPKTRGMKKEMRLNEIEEINLLNKWIESEKPDSGSNPLALRPLPKPAKVGKLEETENGAVYSRYAGVRHFNQLPISDKTKQGLKAAKFTEMTAIQRAAIPHALCGRDILGAAKTGSGKTLAFVIPVIEKLHRESWSQLDGVGCIIISPTRELAAQTFKVINTVGKFHKFSCGLLIGGRDGLDVEKDRVNEMNILVCAPGRLLQHMDETPNFECSNLKILILDEADRVLDAGFKEQLDSIISQLPKRRQTLLFSATQTKKVNDLARLSLGKDPEYLSVHEKPTPTKLKQNVIIVPVENKLDMLWSFIKSHLNKRILVFLSTKKQVKFVHAAFNKLRPGIPLKSLHGKMSQEKRMGVYAQFVDRQSVLFCTDVLARGLDFDKSVDWVIQVDCPDDVESYIHRVGRTARFDKSGKSLLFLTPSEEKMIEKLRDAKIPVELIKPNSDKLQEVSRLLASLLVKFPELQADAQRAFITYLKSIHKKRDKEVFDVSKLSIESFSASLGLPMTPKIRFAKLKTKKSGIAIEEAEAHPVVKKKDLLGDDLEDESFALKPHEEGKEVEKVTEKKEVFMAGTRVLKKKKLKINLHRPLGSKVVFDEEGNSMAPLARVAGATDGEVALDEGEKMDYYKKLREDLKKADEEDKKVDRVRRREKRMKEKIKRKRGDMEEEEEEGEGGSEEEEMGRNGKRAKKIYIDDDNDDGDKEMEGGKIDREYIDFMQEEALKRITQS